jgi:hypothetical protein
MNVNPFALHIYATDIWVAFWLTRGTFEDSSCGTPVIAEASPLPLKRRHKRLATSHGSVSCPRRRRTQGIRLIMRVPITPRTANGPSRGIVQMYTYGASAGRMLKHSSISITICQGASDGGCKCVSVSRPNGSDNIALFSQLQNEVNYNQYNVILITNHKNFRYFLRLQRMVVRAHPNY